MSKRKRRLSIIVPSWLPLFNPFIHHVIESASEDKNIELEVIHLAEWKQFLTFSELAPPNGVITVLPPVITELAEQIKRWGCPIVNISPDWPHHDVPCVTMDQDSVASKAMEYIETLGAASIGYLGFDLARASNIRAEHIQRKAKKLNVPYKNLELNVYPIVESNRYFSIEESDPRLLKFLQKSDRPVAIFAFNDALGAYLTLLCNHLGLDIPNDVMILACGNSQTARINNPPLSSIAWPFRRIAQSAIDLIIQLMDGEPPPPKPVLFPCERIHIRHSTTMVRNQTLNSLFSARDYIREHACDGINVNDIVDQISMSRISFERKYKSYFNSTPGKKFAESS